MPHRIVNEYKQEGLLVEVRTLLFYADKFSKECFASVFGRAIIGHDPSLIRNKKTISTTVG